MSPVRSFKAKNFLMGIISLNLSVFVEFKNQYGLLTG